MSKCETTRYCHLHCLQDLAEAEAVLANIDDEIHRLQMDVGGFSPASAERPSADRDSRWFGV